MEAKELRIGNLVLNPPVGGVRKIDWLDIRDFAEGRLIVPFEPIPLTEEWLLKFGFERDGVTFRRRDDKYIVWDYARPVYSFMLYDDLDSEHTGDIDTAFHVFSKELSRIEFVHQLQNLYFALTQHELTISENIPA